MIHDEDDFQTKPDLSGVMVAVGECRPRVSHCHNFTSSDFKTKTKVTDINTFYRRCFLSMFKIVKSVIEKVKRGKIS